MSDQRRVRFTNIDGLRRPGDLAVAADVWRDDICHSSWATSEAIKIATYLVRYMAQPKAPPLSMSAIERVTQTAPEQIKLALRLLNMFGPVESYVIERDDVKIALHLTSLQKLRVLETQHRLDMLMKAQPVQCPPEAPWQPVSSGEPEPAAEVVAEAVAA